MSFKEIGLDRTIDCHTHSAGADYFNLYKGGLPMVQSTADLISKAKANGVSRIVSFPFPSSGYYNVRTLSEKGIKIPSGSQDFPYQWENRALIMESRELKGVVFPFLAIDPSTRVVEQLDSAQRLFADNEVFGFKIHTAAVHSKADTLISSEFVDFALSRNIPLLVHCGMRDQYSHPENVVNLAKAHSSLRICIAHLACLDEEVIEAVIKSDNLFLDTSPFLQICKRVREGNVGMFYPNKVDPEHPAASLYLYYLRLKDRLIWGTDEPWTRGADGTSKYADEVSVISEVFNLSIAAAYDMTTRNTESFLFGS